jgi:hypothetical protein
VGFETFAEHGSKEIPVESGAIFSACVGDQEAGELSVKCEYLRAGKAAIAHRKPVRGLCPAQAASVARRHVRRTLG